jgi:ABC-type branched-subunit amino acid transport system substrate-binding protein
MAALRVGVLNDMSAGPPAQVDLESWLRFAVAEAAAAGRLDQPVEFVNSWGEGLPGGTAAAVEKAYAELVDADVLMIVGPAIGDNALVATPLAEAYQTPTIHWAGCERARGPYMFHLQVGSHEDESILLAQHVAGPGAQRVSVIYDRSPIGRKHLQFFQEEAELLGLKVSATSISPLARGAEAEVDEALTAQPDAVVYLGLGLAAAPAAQTLAAKGYSGPRAMNTAGLRGYQPDFGPLLEGWTYVDMHSDKNATLRALAERPGAPASSGLWRAIGYDLGRLVAEGLARAPERTRDGVRDGLERVKYLPAAEGHDGTLLGFGVYDRGALHGRYLVLRQWRDGRSVEL